MTYKSELQTYIGTLDLTIDNIGTLSAKLRDFADAADTASSVVGTIDDIGDYAEQAREAIDDQLSVLKLTKQAGPLSTASKLFEKVLTSVRPVVEKIEDTVDKLNGKKDTSGTGDDKDGEFLEKLGDALDNVKTGLNAIADELEIQALDLNETRGSVVEFLTALDKADYAAFDNLKAQVEVQISGRNAVTEPLSDAFNSIVGKVNGVLGIISDAEFEIVEDEFGDFAEISGLLDKIAEPLSVAASVLKPIEPLLDAVGFIVDLVLTPVFDFLTSTLKIDKLIDTVTDEIRALLPDADFLDPLTQNVQALLDDLRNFNTTSFGIENWQLDIDERLYGATVGNALLGPTGFGDDSSEILTGDGGDDILDGRGGDDNIYGQGGNDIIVAGEGNDNVFGGSGTDMVYFSGYLNEYEFAKESDSGKVIVTHVRPAKGAQNEGSTRLDSIEHVVFRNIAFTGTELEEAIIGGSTLNGTSEGELMFLNSSGTPNADGLHVANGFGGDDRIFGSTLNDLLNGGAGNDILLPGFGNDQANGNSGMDSYQILESGNNSPIRVDLVDGTVFGWEGSDTLTGIENLIIQGNGDHFLKGDARNNNILSAGGDDIISGRGGDDFINAGQGRDFIVAGDGADTVLGGDGNDYIVAVQSDIAGPGETYNGGKGQDALSYSSDKNVARDHYYIDVSVSPQISEVLNELSGNDGSVKIVAGKGKVKRLDKDGKIVAVDVATDIEQFIGSDNDDEILGAPGGYDAPITINGAGGNDVLTSNGAETVMGGDDDDRLNATFGAKGEMTGNFDGGSGVDVLDLTGLGVARWWFSLDGSISRSIRAFDADFAGSMRGSGSLFGANVEGIEEFILPDAPHLIDNNAAGSVTRTFRTGAGDDELNNRGGFAIFDAGAGDDYANMMEGGIVYGGLGNDRIEFDDTGTENMALGQQGNDTVVLERLRGTADGGRGYDTLAFDLSNTAGIEYGSVTVDLKAQTAVMVKKFVSFSFPSEPVNAVVKGFEQVIGSEFGDTIRGRIADESLIGREGNDLLDGRDGADRLFGGAGNDTLIGGNGTDKLYGGAGNDTLRGGGGRDTAVYSYAAPDGLEAQITAGNFGGVTVDLKSGVATGSQGTDTLFSIEDVFGSGGNDTLTGNAQRNILSGEGGNDVLRGLDGDDLLITGAGQNTAYGGLGNDRIVVTAGTNAVFGGAGTDTLEFGPNGGTVTIDFAKGTYSGSLKVNTPVWLDDGTTTARDYNGTFLTPEDIQQADALYADSADDLVRVVPAADDPLAGLFRIRDKAVAETASGSFTGIEKIVGGGSAVNLVLSSGTDRYDGTVSGRDFLDFSGRAGDVDFDLKTGATNLAIARGNQISGLEGLKGGSGNDRLGGDDGDNILIGNAGNDILGGGKGGDTLNGGAGSDALSGGVGRDILTGGGGRDELLGQDGKDILLGGGSGDVIKGGDGDDRLDGGGGRDRLTGGNGKDAFVFRKGNDVDILRDFKDNTDVINLKSWNFASKNAAMAFASTTAEGDTEFDFGNGDVLLVLNTVKSRLWDDIAI